MDKLFGAKVSVHRLGNSIWSMKDAVCNESGKTSVDNIAELPGTPEARPQPANFTAKKRQVAGAAPELVSEAGEPILCLFWEHTASPLRRLPKPLLEARSRFLACCQ